MAARKNFVIATDSNTKLKFIQGIYYLNGEFPNVNFPVKRRLIYLEDLKKNDEERQPKILETLYRKMEIRVRSDLKKRKSKEPKKEILKFSDLFDAWIENARSMNFNEKTIKDHYGQIKRQWLFVFPKSRLDQFQKNDIIKFRQYLLNRGLKITSVNSRLKTLQAFFNFLFDQDKIAKPIKIKKIKELKREPAVLTESQIRRLYQDLKEKSEKGRYRKNYKALIRFMIFSYYTGARRNEILYAKRENFDFENSVLIIETEEGKNAHFQIKEKASKKIIPLADELKKFILADWNREDVYYLGDNEDKDGPIYQPMGLTKAFRKRMDALKFPSEIKPAHFWRAKFATTLLNDLKVPLEIASDVLGHSKTDVTRQYYIKKSLKPQLEAVNSIIPFEEL